MTRGLTIALALLASAALLWITLASFTEPPADAPSTQLSESRYALRDAVWTQLDIDGKPVSRIQAAEINYYDDESLQLREVTMDRLGGQDSPWHLQAPRGYGPPDEKRVRLEGGVQLNGDWPQQRPLSLRTETLWVDETRREIYTEAPVEIDGAYGQATARGLRADWDGERVRLLDAVEVHYAPDA